MGWFRQNEPTGNGKQVTDGEVLHALRSVKDPDLHFDIVRLGFIKKLEVEGGHVSFKIELTTPACPVKDRLKAEAEEVVGKLEGVEKVSVEMTSQVQRSTPTESSDGLAHVKNIVAIASGKGGVGKSTVSVNLALALAKSGASVGLMDGDVYGPSVPKMLAGNERPRADQNKLYPIEKYGIKFISMALLTDDDTPVIWRGPMATKLIQQFLGQVEWGELDYLLIDLPPGTGDVQLTLTQSAPLTGAVIVTTPQDVAVNVTMRGVRMFEQVKVPILGIIENMSGFVCPKCNEETDIFRKGGGEEAAKNLGFRYLGGIPLDPQLALSGDAGKPIVLSDAADVSPSGTAFYRLASTLASQVSIVAHETTSLQVSAREVTADDRDVIVKWSDNSETRIPFLDLRLSCPCAGCVDEWSGEPLLNPATVPMSVRPTGFRSVGRYGVQISWSDGHNSGIFTYSTIKDFKKARTLTPEDREKALATQKTAEQAAKDAEPKTLEEKVVAALRTVYDPEIPINIYDLGLIYDMNFGDDGIANIKMTLTAPACPEAETIPPRVASAVRTVEEIKDVNVELVWEPPWDKERMSEAARLQLGL